MDIEKEVKKANRTLIGIVIAILIVLAAAFLVGCGPSRQELEAKAAQEQEKAQLKAKVEAMETEVTSRGKSSIEVTDHSTLNFEQGTVEVKIVKIGSESFILIYDGNNLSTYKSQ